MPRKNLILGFSHIDEKLASFFREHGFHVTYDPWDHYDAAVFTSGPDVSPFLYGARRRPGTYSDFTRDMKENRFYRDLEPKTPKIGIGRGAQFLNVMAGGTLWQHVTGHTDNHHLMDFFTGESLTVTSKHHQEMVPTSEAHILGMSNVAEKKYGEAGELTFDVIANDSTDACNDVEVVYYKAQNSFCFQPRPELGHAMTAEYFLRMAGEFIFNDIK